MIEQDTVRLLRECDAGITMGIDSIEDVLDRVKNTDLRDMLVSCQREHQKLRAEVDQLLDRYQDDGKEPNPIAKGMSWMKTNMKMTMEGSDATIADDRRLQHGCQIPQQVSEPVQGCRRKIQRYRQTADQSGAAADSGFAGIPVTKKKHRKTDASFAYGYFFRDLSTRPPMAMITAKTIMYQKQPHLWLRMQA